MVDGDLAKYAGTACTLDVLPPETAPARCDMYVQPDKAGTLVGYAAVSQFADGVSIETAITAGGRGCTLSGKIYDSNYEKPVSDASRDFDGRMLYSAWKNYRGEFLVSQVHPDNIDSQTGALGVWYIAKKVTSCAYLRSVGITATKTKGCTLMMYSIVLSHWSEFHRSSEDCCQLSPCYLFHLRGSRARRTGQRRLTACPLVIGLPAELAPFRLLRRECLQAHQ